MYRFNVNIPQNRKAWDEFCSHCRRLTLASLREHVRLKEHIDRELVKWNAVDIYGTHYLEFETLEDLDYFVLYWTLCQT